MSLHPDMDLGRRYLAARHPPGRLILCAVTGSHYYGFPSPDSDLDLKGIHAAPAEAFLGLSTPPEAHDKLEVFEGVECDLTTHEALKAIHLLLRGNGNMLERIFSPFQLVDTTELADLRDLARRSLSRRFFWHYRGFFQGICKEHEAKGQRRGKSLLYAYRVALTGAHLLKTGEVVGNLIDIAEAYGFPEAIDLAEAKRAGAEKGSLPPDEDARHREAWPRLMKLLEESRAESPLPEEPSNEAELSAWLELMRTRELFARRALHGGPGIG